MTTTTNASIAPATQAPSRSAAGDAKRRLPAPASLTLWALVQLLSLIIASNGVRLYSHMPEPPQQQSLKVVLIAQIVTFAMLRPVLVNGWLEWCLLIAFGWPAVQAAAFIGGQTTADAFRGWASVAAWCCAWSGVGQLRRTRGWSTLMTALCALLTIGLPVLAYLRAEFQPQAPPLGFSALSPIALTMESISQSNISSEAATIIVYASFGLFCFAGNFLRLHRRHCLRSEKM